MLEELKKEVFEANLKLVEYGLVIFTWGNASAISEDRKYVVIKPSGMSYQSMTPEDMVVTDLYGNVVEGKWKASSDLLTHLELYRHFSDVGGIVHTHSRYSTAIAQAEKGIPCYGTTHADNFFGTIPCTRNLTREEVEENYELNTGKVIVETFENRGIDPLSTPAVLVCKHGPFSWGENVKKAVENARVLDEVACMAILSNEINPHMTSAADYLMDKHYSRKHGEKAYYGQK